MKKEKTAPKPYNMAKLDALHDTYLLNPASAKDVAKAARAYAESLRAREQSDADMAKHIKAQQAVARRRRATNERHAKLKAEMRAEQEEIEVMASEAYEQIQKESEKQKTLKEWASELAEQLALAQGVSPVEIEGSTYDFGCYGESVYLRKRQKVAKGKR